MCGGYVHQGNNLQFNFQISFVHHGFSNVPFISSVILNNMLCTGNDVKAALVVFDLSLSSLFCFVLKFTRLIATLVTKCGTS